MSARPAELRLIFAVVWIGGAIYAAVSFARILSNAIPGV